jgi:cell fate (sporulation/competence/biofilm development) regulator YmcA (YheA/YmcA/DUF963 family)
MSILSALRTQTDSIDDLAALPQAMIMQMAQKKQIREDMIAPILSRKAEMAEASARNQALKSQGQQPTVMEQLMQRNAVAEQPAPEQQTDVGIGQLPVNPGMFQEQSMAGGGIVAFEGGGGVEEEELTDAQLIAEMRKDRQAIKDRAAEDKNLALLAAGLGIMGGTSPFALSNIGSGAMKGVEQLATSSKNRAAELEALNKNLSSTMAAKNLNERRIKEAEELAKYREDQLNIRKEGAGDRADARDLAAIQKIEGVINRNPIVADFKKRMELLDPSDDMYKYYSSELEKVYKNAYENAGIKTPRISYTPGPIPTKEEEPGFFSKYGSLLTPSFGGSKPASGVTMRYDKQGNLQK